MTKSKALQFYSKSLRKSLTPAEAIVWKALKGNQLGVKFRKQHVIEKYIADFYAPSIKLVIEIDGGIHDDPVQQFNDLRRDDFMESKKITILRISNDEVYNDFDLVINRIQNETKKLKQI